MGEGEPGSCGRGGGGGVRGQIQEVGGEEEAVVSRGKGTVGIGAGTEGGDYGVDCVEGCVFS